MPDLRSGLPRQYKAVLSAGFLIIAIFAALAISPRASFARTCADARVAERAGKSFLAAARNGSPAAFSRALRRNLGARRVAFFALGRHRRKLPRSQYGRFVKLADRYIARKLAGYAASFRGNSLKIVGCRGRVVESRLQPRGSRVLWRIHRRRIIDVNIESVWLMQLLRDHFDRLVREVEGDMRAFLARLR